MRKLSYLVYGFGIGFLVSVATLWLASFYIGVPEIHNGQEFHDWVNGLSWWQRSCYDLFNPDMIHCTAVYDVGFQPVFFLVLIDISMMIVYFLSGLIQVVNCGH